MDKNYGYKHTKGFIIFILIVLCMYVVAAHSQVVDSTTGNLMNPTSTATTSTSTWQNAVYQNGLTCWEPGGPGYCGPLPIWNTSSNTLNFSYGIIDVYQKVNVAKALPYSGAGLVTTGFNFSWMSKNGNGWQPEVIQDVLSAYVKLYNTGDKKVIEDFYWNLNYIHNWTTFNYSKNWANTKIGYRPNDVGNVQFGFVGGDTSYWAGPYGPEVENISFSLKYKPDPCKNNPLFSPECPKFTEELAKMNATPTTTVTTTSTVSYELIQSSPPPKDTKDTSEPPPRYEEGTQEYDPTDRLIDTLFKIADNQAKEEKLTMDASESAIKETEKVSLQVTKQAEKVADKNVQQSIADSMMGHGLTIQENTTKDNRAEQSLSLFHTPAVIISGFQLPNQAQNGFTLPSAQSMANQSMVTFSSVDQPKQQTQQSMYSLTNTFTTEVSTNVGSVVQLNQPTFTSSQLSNNLQNQQLAMINPLANQLVETPTTRSSFLTNRTDPINIVLDNRVNQDDKQQNTTMQTVKSNVQDNDAAAGVSIDSIARTPVGFNNYMIALKDVAFYAPKEIYRNQKTVDNVRALRQLASDRLHQEMVDQQYKR